MELGSVGVWRSGTRNPGGVLDEGVARSLEDLGYGAIWMSGGFEPGLSPRFAQILDATDDIVVASGIVSIWVTPPDEIALAVAQLAEAHPGRFLLGLGTSHAPAVQHYERPYSKIVAYLDGLDAATPGVSPEHRILAALGPKMLELAGARSAGAHPYFIPVEHTRLARQILGEGPVLAPELTVVLDADRDRGLELARTFTSRYLALPNYANNLRSLGFSESDLAGAGSDRLVDAVVAVGDAHAAAERVNAHLDAGADHVCVQVVAAGEGFPMAAYRALADVLF